MTISLVNKNIQTTNETNKINYNQNNQNNIYEFFNKNKKMFNNIFVIIGLIVFLYLIKYFIDAYEQKQFKEYIQEQQQIKKMEQIDGLTNILPYNFIQKR